MTETESTGESSAPAPGWWLASDGNWYPPEQAPAPQAAPPPPGAPTPGYGYQPPAPTQQPNGIAVAALVCGIVGAALGIVPFFFLIAWILGVLAVIFGLKGRRRAKEGLGRGGMAKAGWILGLVSIVLGIVGVVLISTVETNSDRIDNLFEVNGGDFKATVTTCEGEASGTLRASGTIENTSGDLKVGNLEVHVKWLDSGGKVIATESDTVSTPTGLASDFKTSFEVSSFSSSGASRVAKCSVSLSG